jgi:hypothetical protein
VSKETRPKGESSGEDLLTPELANTELAPSKDAPTRTGPRVAGPKARAGAAGASAAPGARVVGRFRIDAQLGSGGMGDVYRAYDPVLDRAVALKVLRTDRSADDQQRMRRVVREARAAAALTHPNTVTIFEVGEADREVFIAMELLEGEDLRAVMERGEASIAEKLRWLLEAARALGAAHERGLVHRDVKPENMFVCKGGTLKLLDFGIAKRGDDEGAPLDAAVDMGPSSLRTTEGRRIGTPRYMAPEQHAGDATDPRTDEYAWGLVAFELLAGAHVVADLRTKTTDGGEATPDPALSSQRLDVLRAKAPEVSETVLRTIGRALEPRKGDRFPSMAPIVAALEEKATAKSEPHAEAHAEAPPLPPAPRVRSWVVLPAIATVVVAGLFALRAATHATSGAHAGAASTAVPACGLASSRTFKVGPDDRLAVLPDGTVIVARDIRKGLALERETPAGLAPVPRNPLIDAIGDNYRNLSLRGLMYEGTPATFVDLDQDEKGALIALFAGSSMASQRIFGSVNGLAATTFGDGIVVIATIPEVTLPRFGGLPNGAEAYRLGHSAGTYRSTIEEGGAAAPAVAVQRDRVAVAYESRAELHFALLDEGLARIGDVQTIAHTTSAPAVAFGPGDTPVVFWVDAAGGKTRLYGSSFAPGSPGNKAFSPPKVAIDEALAPHPPVTAQLPSGSWVVAWIASTGGRSTVRVSPIGAAGALSGPSDLATGERIDGLRSVSTSKGIDLWWYEGDALVRIAEVTCPGFSASMGRP